MFTPRSEGVSIRCRNSWAGYRRPDAWHRWCAVHVAIETGDAAARAFGTAVLGLIELLLRGRRHQEAESPELLRIQNSVEQFIVVVDCHQFALGDIAQIRPRGQINGWRKFRHDMVG